MATWGIGGGVGPSHGRHVAIRIRIANINMRMEEYRIRYTDVFSTGDKYNSAILIKQLQVLLSVRMRCASKLRYKQH